MFDKLPDLFDKNFFIGHFLPAALILCGASVSLYTFGFLPGWLRTDSAATYFNAAIVIALIWLTAIALLALNYPLLRIAEGYGRLHPLAWRKEAMKARFGETVPALLRTQEGIDEARAQGVQALNRPQDHSDRLRNAVEAFPHNERFVLPTEFGNRFRAIEIYSSVVYGLDAIPAWGRLQAVVPEAFGKRLDEAKSQLDFSINLMYGGAVIALLHLGLAIYDWSPSSLWLPVVAVGVSVIGSVMGASALSQYGLYVKSAFDLYRGELAKQLGLVMPRSSVHERIMWADVSRVWVYRSAAAYDRLTKFRPKGGHTGLED